jgi:flagellar basal-body rod modification protein FlgD
LALGGVNLSENVDQLRVQIIDSTGKVVQTQDLGAQKAGVINFAWDGKDDTGAKLADGTYKISVQALRGGEKVTADALQVGTVSALVRSGGGFLLDLGALGRVDFKTVQQIL